MRQLALLALLACLLPSPAAAARLLLAIGHDRGAPDQAPLRFSEREADEFASLMVQLGAVQGGDAQVLAHPSLAAVWAALDELDARVRLASEPMEVLLYLSGHARDGALALGNELLPLAELRTRIEALDAEVVVAITDTCTSATLLRRKGLAAAGSFAMELEPLAPSAPRGQVWIASAGPSEPSYESDRAGGSLFARNLFAALRGAADRDGDGEVTLSEAYGYLYSRTLADALAEAGSPQHPHLEVSTLGAGELVLTQPGRGGATIVLGEELAGAEVWVVDTDRGRAVVELADVSAGTVVGLYPGNFTVYTRHEGQARLRSLHLAAGQTHRLLAEGQLASLRPIRTRGGAVLPGRWELSALVRAAGPLVKGGATVLGGGVSLEGQLSRWLRVGGAVSTLGGSFATAPARVTQLEFGAGAGAWFSPAGLVQPVLGGRLGVLGILQRPAPPEPSWYSIGALPSPPRSAIAPSITLETGLLLRLGPRFVARVGADAGVVLLPGVGAPDPALRWGATLSLGGVL